MHDNIVILECFPVIVQKIYEADMLTWSIASHRRKQWSRLPVSLVIQNRPQWQCQELRRGPLVKFHESLILGDAPTAKISACWGCCCWAIERQQYQEPWRTWMWKMCIWLNQAGWQRSLEDWIHQSPHRHEREDHCFLTREITWL
jgi:hypothetical protein